MGKRSNGTGASFRRQVERLRRVAGELQHTDPEGAAACLFAASVLSHMPQSTGIPTEIVEWPTDEMRPDAPGE